MRWVAAAVFLLAAVVIVPVAIYHHFKVRFERPGPLASEQVLIIEPGAGLGQIARQLHDAGVVEDDLTFRLGVRMMALSRSLKAGEYAFPAGVSMRDAAGIMASGKAVFHPLTIPEGLTSREILALVRDEPKLTGALPSQVPSEGALLPETYSFTRGDDRAALVARMRAAMDGTLMSLWPKRQSDLPIESPEEAIILASIVEKETGVPEERPLVASVFVNRLRKGMRLQSDPTVAFGITLGEAPLGRLLTQADLRAPTAYNTYQIDRLPPGPIANPGRAAIEAVLHPAETAYLYFVADGTGGHAFAKTLEQHNKNVAKWRKIQRARKSNPP